MERVIDKRFLAENVSISSCKNIQMLSSRYPAQYVLPLSPKFSHEINVGKIKPSWKRRATQSFIYRNYF